MELGDYERLRVDILPVAPFQVPDCMIRELALAERCCRDKTTDNLFPIRFLWALEASEQRLFGLRPLGRSRYHPEKLLELWQRASTDGRCRNECVAAGFVFDFAERAMKLSAGWIYIGERFVEDFLEVETTLGVELRFPHPTAGEVRPAFQLFKQHQPGWKRPAEPGGSGTNTSLEN